MESAVLTSAQWISMFDNASLRLIWEYFKDDLIYILQYLDTDMLLNELESSDVLKKEKYIQRKEEWGTVFFCNLLFQDILELGREALIGFWKCVCLLQEDHPHPNFLAVLNEISQTGKRLVAQILLDEHGHPLSPELMDFQVKHKQHLLERSQTLVECKPPGSTLEQQSFIISERFVSLNIVSAHEFRQRPQNELLETGMKHEKLLKQAESGLEHISPNRLFRWSHQLQCIPHAVMVSGVPGVGKTTLMQKFIYDWVTGKLYQRFAFVFFFKFRELNKLAEVSLEDMIICQYPYLESQLGNILQAPERLLCIFDGLDESIHQMDFRSSKQCTHTKWRADVSVIVDSLVRQTLLKGCSVLITSRPTRLVSADTGVFQRITEIIGFLHVDRRIYFEHFFESNELSSKAFNYVCENERLYTFCYIPTYCWIICTVLSMCFRAQPKNIDQLILSLPKTVTQLFVTFISNILTNHSPSTGDAQTTQKLLTSLGRLAEYGVMNHILIFDDRDLESFGVRAGDPLLSCFMVESGQSSDVNYTFLHSILQEFLAALVHFIDYNSDRLQESLTKAEYYKDGRAKIFLCFLCGLSDNSTRSLLKCHLLKLSPQASRNVITWLQQETGRKQSDIFPTENKKWLLNIFYCLHETRNKALVSQCFKTKIYVDLSFSPLTLLDCSVLSFTLQSSRENEELNLKACDIQSEGLKRLSPILQTFRNLRLGFNELTDFSCTYLGIVIKNNQMLRILDLSNNNLEGPHFSELMAALITSRIEEIFLRQNKLTDYSCEPLACGIRYNQTLRKLDLSHNNLGGRHFSELMAALGTSRIEELLLAWNCLTSRSCIHLATGIKNNQTLMKLDLSYNSLEGPDLSVLMEILATSRIEELNLKYNDLTDSSCVYLASGLRNNQTLKTLDLSNNNLEGPHFSDLMTALKTCTVEDLLLTNNNLGDNSNIHLTSGITNAKTLRTLNLSLNNLTGPHFRDLMEALKTSKIETLIISSYWMSPKVRTELKALESHRSGLNIVFESS